MKKFKVLTSILFISVLFIPDIKAQWNKDISQNLLVSKENDINEESVKLVKTKDDNMFITWLSWENLNNKPNYFFKMQILDKEGNPRLNQGGTFICTQPTYTWTSGYDIAYTPDDCLLFTTTDARNGDAYPYIYKISRKGEQLWGSKGIQLMGRAKAGAFSPKVCVSKENKTNVCYIKMDDISVTSMITKLSIEGKILSHIEIPNAIRTSINNCDYDSIFTTWIDINSNFYMQKYDEKNNPVWKNPYPIDESKTVRQDSSPNIQDDGENGFVIAWKFNETFDTTLTKIQRFNSDGKPMFKKEIIIHGDVVNSIAVNKRNRNIYIVRQIYEGFASLLILDIYDFDGNIIRDKILIGKGGTNYKIYGIIPTRENGLTTIYEETQRDYKASPIFYTTINEKYDTLIFHEPVSTSESEKHLGSAIMLKNGEIITAWSEDRTNIKGNYCGSIYAQNIPYKYATNEINSETSKQTSITVYPNPAQNEIYIKPETDFENQTIRIFITDMYGQTISELYSGILNETKQFDISRLKQGIYFIKTENSGQSTVNKLIISK